MNKVLKPAKKCPITMSKVLKPDGSSGGTTASLKKEQLLDIRLDEDSLVNDELVDDVSKAWYHLLYGIMLLAAATDPPDSDQKHTVPGPGDTEQKWMFTGLGNKYKERKKEVIPKDYKKFQTNVLQAHDGYKPLLIKKFWDQIDKSLLFREVDQMAILHTCESSISAMIPEPDHNRYHNDTKDYVKKAISQIESLWKLAPDVDITKVNGWISDKTVGSENWLTKELQIATLDFDNVTEENKIAIGTKGYILDDINRETYDLVDERLKRNSGIHDLEGVLDSLSKALPDKYKDAWQDLLSTTQLMIVWLIFTQAAAAVTQVQKILQEP